MPGVALPLLTCAETNPRPDDRPKHVWHDAALGKQRAAQPSSASRMIASRRVLASSPRADAAELREASRSASMPTEDEGAGSRGAAKGSTMLTYDPSVSLSMKSLIA